MSGLSRLPKQVDLKLYAGDSETFGLVLTDRLIDEPVNVFVGQWDAQIKPEAEGVVEEFTVTVDPVVAGQMELFIDAGASQRLGALSRPLRWDLQQTIDESTVITHAQGVVRMIPDVTRIDL